MSSLMRLIPGLALIVAVSTLLLVSDANRRKNADGPKVWNIHIIEYIHSLDIEESQAGILKGLAESGLVEGKDYRITIQNASGDMAAIGNLIDAAITDGADMLITLSTPTLQSAMGKTSTLPIVFTYVSDPVAAGAAKTQTDHRPNVTGINTMGPYAEQLAALRECLPDAKRVGTLYCPAEVNMVVSKDILAREAEKLGMEVIALPANTPSDVGDAALALCGNRLDAICQIGGNLTSSSFPSLLNAARQAKLPIFAVLANQAKAGAAVAIARDYYDGGLDTGRMAAEIIRGRSPADIPIAPIRKIKILVNLNAARVDGLRIPQSLLSRADVIIGK